MKVLAYFNLTAFLLFSLSNPSFSGNFEDGIAAVEAGDFEKAHGLWVIEANKGNVKAQFNLGLMYDSGMGVPQDYKQAVDWYRQAAEQGHANSQYNLGVMYDNGIGVLKDYSEAVDWYLKAAKQGHAKAQNNLGNMLYDGRGVKQSYEVAYAWYVLAVANGNEMAKKNLETLKNQLTSAQIERGQKVLKEILGRMGS
ncbi:MAG: sel1 repeat family protein [Deltaproteobacteria bacterium]|nr:sel1 repeat family protein [Deltaproteobacteria bacterium]